MNDNAEINLLINNELSSIPPLTERTIPWTTLLAATRSDIHPSHPLSRLCTYSSACVVLRFPSHLAPDIDQVLMDEDIDSAIGTASTRPKTLQSSRSVNSLSDRSMSTASRSSGYSSANVSNTPLLNWSQYHFYDQDALGVGDRYVDLTTEPVTSVRRKSVIHGIPLTTPTTKNVVVEECVKNTPKILFVLFAIIWIGNLLYTPYDLTLSKTTSTDVVARAVVYTICDLIVLPHAVKEIREELSMGTSLYFVSTLPIHLLGLISYNAQHITLFRLTKFVVLGTLFTPKNTFHYAPSYDVFSHIWVRLLVITTFTLASIHCVACGILALEDTSYATSFFWSLRIFFYGWNGSVVFKSDGSVCLAVILRALGVSASCVALGSLNLALKPNHSIERYRSRLQMLESELRDHKLTKSLKDEIREYFSDPTTDLNFRSLTMFQDIPTDLFEKVVVHVAKMEIMQCESLVSRSPLFLKALLQNLTAKCVMPDTRIVKEGEIMSLYYIVSGSIVALEGPHQEMVGAYGDGDVVGGDKFMLKSDCTLRAATYCSMLQLSKDHVRKLRKTFPHDTEQLEEESRSPPTGSPRTPLRNCRSFFSQSNYPLLGQSLMLQSGSFRKDSTSTRKDSSSTAKTPSSALGNSSSLTFSEDPGSTSGASHHSTDQSNAAPHLQFSPPDVSGFRERRKKKNSSSAHSILDGGATPEN